LLRDLVRCPFAWFDLSKVRERDFVRRARTADIDLVELANEKGCGMTALGAQSGLSLESVDDR